MNKIPKISDAEWIVMKVLWDKSPLTANDIVEAIDEEQWTPTTIRTLISRLVRKGALGFEKSGRQYLYAPEVEQEACTHHERKSFMRRVYDGAAQPMLAHILEEEDLTPEELESLRRIVEAKMEEQS